MKLCVLVLLLSASGFASGRIAGVITFKGRPPHAEKLKPADPACAGGELSGREVLVRITKNAPRPVAPSAPVVLETLGCVTRPFVLGAMKGQRLQLKNSDAVPHSWHAWLGARTLFEVGQPSGAKPIEKELKGGELVKVTCDLHPGIRSYVLIADYFAVASDDGAFEIKDVPPGTYGVEAWSERLGTLSAEVTVEEGKVADPKFVFTSK